MRKLVALVFFSSVFVIAFSAQAQRKIDYADGYYDDLKRERSENSKLKTAEKASLVGENIIKSDKVFKVVKKASSEGRIVVVYSDTTFSGGFLHEDIVSLGIEISEDGKERVVVTGQYGQPSAVYGNEKTREEWVANHKDYNASIDAFVVVSKEKLEQLEGYTVQCSMKQRPYLVSTCWSYAETTWNDWQKMAEPDKKRTSICDEVNETYSGTCTGLKFVCSSMHCQASRPTYAECVKKSHDAINSCMHNNTYCIDSHIKSKEDCVSKMVEPVHERFKKKDAAPAATPELAKTPEPPKPKGSSRSAQDVAAACKKFNSMWTGGAEGRAKIEAGAPPEQAAFYQSAIGMSDKFCDCLGDQLVNKQLGTAEEIDQVVSLWNMKSWDAMGTMSAGVGRASAACANVLQGDIMKMHGDATRMSDEIMNSMPR